MENIWNVALDERIYRNALATTTTQYLLQCRQLSPARGTKPPLGFLSPSLTSKASTKAPSRKLTSSQPCTTA
ncbi:Hypothetical protein FKW44_003861 [Caligus rogercresseyi]|uniref:Uncharacterized protein n=1 Tax=Caligus rogercresseyi TaxID=217165 RepID=A0A7T8KM87_CALRO|nr:Hypothetical protein FKW44_003861 [Caligus rogercresseyi]